MLKKLMLVSITSLVSPRKIDCYSVESAMMTLDSFRITKLNKRGTTICMKFPKIARKEIGSTLKSGAVIKCK